jgi:AcrR family transcriptional regulator
MSRDGYHHGDLRAALIDAARRLLERGGPRGTTLRAIARDAGVSPAAPYHHFTDLETLLAALAAEGFGDLGDGMTRAAARAPDRDPLHRLQAAGVAYVRFAVRNPELFRLMFSGMLKDRSTYPELEEAADATFAVLQGLIGDPPGRTGGPLPGPGALAAWSTVHGLAVLLIEGRLGDRPSERKAARIARDVTEVLGVGLRAVGSNGRERGRTT